ncbi:unnamed protein product (macronuclear) [Paramecium tetraurelia]|uniref:Transmembrane protein n=1 Tax=Paramecium tetraurelia TaxID=5888 RepID=A0BDQ9_PARTE|nr:uncharacterized protein GSPATT00027706001 [Paramecium tetraurelia]CAK56676.1 unnamed protein product [Paramecium tetraurelia]|eukprot:XP_001424074.1 hypothetical protein (macronuclear) [Paramecium tetraurelia strain d4-2]
MFLAFMIQIVFGCQVYEKERNLFPTEEEYYNVYMNELFNGDNMIFQCKNCPENVTLWNTMNLIGKPFNTGYIFRSIANNNSHFVALSDNNTINIYNWQNQSLKTGQILNIGSDLNCLNVVFTLDDQFLLDCYIGDMIQIYYLEGLNLSLVFQDYAAYPLRTNLYSFRSNQINYTIYAQYYKQYQILTLLKYDDSFQNQQFINVSTWASIFQDVEISIKGIEVNTFYVLNNQEIILLKITEDEKFSSDYFFLINPPSQQMTIYQSVNKYSECDQLFLKSNSLIYSLLVCEDQPDQELYQQDEMFYQIDENIEIQQFYANDLFLILQTNNSLMIISLETKTLLRQSQAESMQNFTNSQIYFNQQRNELMIFNYYTYVYQLEIPRLSGYFQVTDTKKQMDEIYIFAIDNFGIDICFVKLKVKTLNLNDYDVYELYENQVENFYTFEQKRFVQQIKNINGPLLEIQYNQNNYNLGAFNNITFYKLYDFNKEFEMMKMIYIETTYIVGIQNKSMTIFVFELPELLDQSSVIQLDTQDHQILRDLQLAYSFQESQVTIIIGINFDQTTLLFYFVTEQQADFTILSNITVSTMHFNQFLLTFNCYILMFDNKIILYSFDNVKQIKVDQETIQQYLGEYVDFNPTEMTLDQQLQSSVVFVSNQYNFIIFVIDFALRMIPYGIYYVDYIIQQINIVNQKLILSYKCDQGLCFDVWNTQNLLKPFYEKKLMSISQQNGVTCYSDNLFYYVKIDKKQTLIYNPMLSYHQSLFTSIQLNGSYFSSIVVEGLSALAFGNNLYSLFPFFTFEFIRNNSYQTFEYLPSTIYNFTIRSQLNGGDKSYTTNNQSLSILNPQLNMFIENITIVIEDESDLKYTYTFDNVSTIGQILYFELEPEDDRHQISIKNFQNAIQLSSQLNNDDQFTILTVVNNLFVLQNYNKLMIQNTNVVFNLNDTQICYQSYAYNSTLYSYCQNNSSYYIISFQINNISIVQNEQIIILPNNELYVSETSLSVISDGLFYLTPDSYLYYYNLQSKQNVIITQCNTNTFQPIVIKQASNYLLIAVFYVCQDNDKYLSYIIGNYSKINYTIQFQNNFRTIDIIETYFSNIGDFYIQHLQVIKQELKEIIMLITTNQQLIFLILFNVNYGIHDNTDIEIKFQDIISTIAPYNTIDFEIQQHPRMAGSNLLIFLSNKKITTEFLLLVYDLADLSQFNRSSPIRLQGGYIIPQMQYNFILGFQIFSENRNKGQILILTEQNIYNFNFSTFTFCLDMPLYSKEKYITFRLTGANTYFSTTSLIQFQYETQEGWLYGLYTIIAAIMIISLIYCWQRRKAPNDYEINNDEWIEF